jgi:uncharacterized protein (DUF342 family)
VDSNVECFFIRTNDEGVFLTVNPTPAGCPAVSVGQVLDSLHGQQVLEYNRLVVEEAVRNANGSPVKIADLPKKVREAEISVIVSRDRMEAFLQIDAAGDCAKPSLEIVAERIQQAGVTQGVLPESISAALRQITQRVLCAKGTPPENGLDAQVKHLIDLSQRGKPAELHGGGVDFKDLGLYINVVKGQVLAEKIPATAGVPGMDVCGNPIPAKPGKDVVLHPGANIHVVDDVKLVAAAGGNLVVTGGKLSISPVLQIKGDVDLSTGNINFAGDVIIRGSVSEGFSVKAGGNVDIAGMVSGGSVEGANVTVRQGIVGLNKAVIKATDTVTAKFVENARIAADQVFLIQDVVLHSHLSAGQKVRVEGRRGQIVGGLVAAGDEIVAKTAGNTSIMPTDLQAGVNPKLREEYMNLRKELRTMESSLDQIQKGLFTLRSMDQGQLPPEKKELLLKITRAQFTTLGQVEAMRKRLAELETAYEELKSGQVKISDTVYPGVKITIGSLIKPVQEELRFVTFYADAGEIKFRPLR